MMKGFTKIMLIIASVAIGVLLVVVASDAWFTSNPFVDANEVSLSSANTLVVAFDSTNYKSNYSYRGQDGNSETYVYPYGYFKVNLSNSFAEKRSIIKMDFTTVDMECAICDIQDILIDQLFQVQIACYQEESGGAYDMESQDSSDPNYRVFENVGTGNGHYKLIADDYYLGADNYLYRASTETREELPQGVYYFAFTYTFCPANADHYGYTRDDEGTYIGQVSYQQIAGGTAYAYSNGSYAQSDSGEYSRVVTEYVTSVTKYTKNGANSYSEDPNGTYIKIKDHLGNVPVGNNDDNNFVEFQKYSRVTGFPYSNIKYQGARYSFSIVCSVEEV